jgi:hypothetical protein
MLRSAFEQEAVERSSVVYVARVLLPAAMASGAYGWKVGFTTHMRQRAIDLVSVSRDVEFVAATHGRRRDESNIHRALRHHALSGGREWYPDSDEVRAYLAALPFAWRGSVRLLAVERDDTRASGYDRNGPYVRALADVCAAWRRALGGGAPP